MPDLHITVRCPKVGCPRSISYCYKCDDMKETKKADNKNIQNRYGDNILTCDWNKAGTMRQPTKNT